MSKIKDQNKWARLYIKSYNRMKCEKCGKIVHINWMKEGLEEEIGQRCGPCSNENSKNH